jgi:hypothetical protein
MQLRCVRTVIEKRISDENKKGWKNPAFFCFLESDVYLSRFNQFEQTRHFGLCFFAKQQKFPTLSTALFPKHC